jgi:hypothetical protein
MKVQLRYFKPSGKWYADGEYETQVPDSAIELIPGVRGPALFRIWEEVAAMKADRTLPGLRSGHSDFTVLVDVPDHPHRHPHLIPGSEPV